MAEFNRLEFIKSQRPKEPFYDWRVWSLFVPAVCSAIGFVIFAIIGYSFTEFSSIHENVRLWLVIVGGITLAIGGEIGTIFTTIEIGRKHKLDDVNGWDKGAIAFSLITTLAGFVLGLATLLGEFAGWSRPVQVWGSIVVGALAGIDAYFGYWETGYLFADYTKRVNDWFLLMEQEQDNLSPADIQDFQSQINNLQKVNADLQSQLDILHKPPADLQWFTAYVASMNGQLAQYKNLDAYEAVSRVCALGERRFDKTERTAKTWYEVMK